MIKMYFKYQDIIGELSFKKQVLNRIYAFALALFISIMPLFLFINLLVFKELTLLSIIMLFFSFLLLIGLYQKFCFDLFKEKENLEIEFKPLFLINMLIALVFAIIVLIVVLFLYKGVIF